MRNFNICFAAIAFLLAFSVTHSAMAQSGVIIESIDKTFDEAAFSELYTDSQIWDNAKLRTKTFLETNLDKLEKVAIEIGQPPEVEKTKMYIQGKGNMFRVDSESSDDRKMTIIFDKNLGMMFQINWSEMTKSKMSVEDMKKMSKGVQDFAKNMPSDTESMLKYLPKDQQEKIKKALEAQGYDFQESSGKGEKSTITATGNKKDFKNFPNCSEFRGVVEGNKHFLMWAYGGNPGLSKMFHELDKEFENSFGIDDEEKEPYALLPKDKFPVLTITYEENIMTSQMDYQVYKTLKVEETDIPLSIFQAYKDPNLKEVSMMDAMKMK
ncbi:MAG: hypothetical protein ACE5JB_16200 [bacterium]